MSYAFDPAPQVSVPIAGREERFPVRRIYCVGRNYADHAREMGHDPDRDPPFFFTKPADALVTDGADAPYPKATEDLHHEVELVVALGPGGQIFGQAVGVDLTRRDIQAEAKKLSRPWDMAKGFDASAPIGAIQPSDRPSTEGAINLRVNGEVRQSGNVNQMIWSTEEVIEHLNGLLDLKAGDLIFTGTPAGVGQIVKGDKVECEVEGLPRLSFALT